MITKAQKKLNQLETELAMINVLEACQTEQK
ncbi:hypothetical protein DOD24_1471 [Staphylococcus arlettae]|uniref:Uncharacterized protein n=1 Tax=Staphylococcus arlettae TaxID=29378 RepID=A0A380CUK2_9STAP|nr:hypothetical protein [Staphylococcus arlettae]RBA01763.1 hypothetical protein DOD23_1950 [Staphylococcus arlettae]RBA02174.1 hypothetical protein DOD22_2293 [Staphylococcus arlettae]RBA07001.1 hypothetical protein DOD24_1471 [Staphylococcus arlettae]SUJ27801.1 Uncharacterised protein [Staphylococcus arlettae]